MILLPQGHRTGGQDGLTAARGLSIRAPHPPPTIGGPPFLALAARLKPTAVWTTYPPAILSARHLARIRHRLPARDAWGRGPV
jgi:hypothetical protein